MTCLSQEVIMILRNEARKLWIAALCCDAFSSAKRKPPAVSNWRSSQNPYSILSPCCVNQQIHILRHGNSQHSCFAMQELIIFRCICHVDALLFMSLASLCGRKLWPFHIVILRNHTNIVHSCLSSPDYQKMIVGILFCPKSRYIKYITLLCIFR